MSKTRNISLLTKVQLLLICVITYYRKHPGLYFKMPHEGAILFLWCFLCNVVQVLMNWMLFSFLCWHVSNRNRKSVAKRLIKSRYLEKRHTTSLVLCEPSIFLVRSENIYFKICLKWIVLRVHRRTDDLGLKAPKNLMLSLEIIKYT